MTKEPPSPQRNNAGSQSPEPLDRRDIWDKVDILSRPLGALLTAVMVALIGWYGQQVLQNQQDQTTKRIAAEQAEATKRAAAEQNTRLYTELLSRREEAESALRKDMFAAIFEEFFVDADSALKSRREESADERSQRISRLLLKLELLALNFGESLSLTPLFLELDRELEIRQKGVFWQLERDIFRKRLRGLARRVAERQLSALGTGGTSFDIDVPLMRIVNSGSYTWPDAVFTPFPALSDADGDADMPDDGEQTINAEARDALSVIRCGGADKQFRMTFSNANLERKTIDVDLEIYDRGDLAGKTAHSSALSFTLDFFNFPMIDNTKLTGNTRFALILTQFDLENIEVDNVKVTGICFPGSYASERDKPFLTEVLDSLKQENQGQ